jgi:hypothetical protein
MPTQTFSTWLVSSLNGINSKLQYYFPFLFNQLNFRLFTKLVTGLVSDNGHET